MNRNHMALERGNIRAEAEDGWVQPKAAPAHLLRLPPLLRYSDVSCHTCLKHLDAMHQVRVRLTEVLLHRSCAKRLLRAIK